MNITTNETFGVEFFGFNTTTSITTTEKVFDKEMVYIILALGLYFFIVIIGFMKIYGKDVLKSVTTIRMDRSQEGEHKVKVHQPEYPGHVLHCDDKPIGSYGGVQVNVLQGEIRETYNN